jgi:hypothetical protein
LNLLAQRCCFGFGGEGAEDVRRGHSITKNALSEALATHFQIAQHPLYLHVSPAHGPPMARPIHAEEDLLIVVR